MPPPSSMEAKSREEAVSIQVGEKSFDGCITWPDTSNQQGVILAHGAGGDMNLPQLCQLATQLATAGFTCLRFTCRSLDLLHRTRVYTGVVEYLQQSHGDKIKSCYLAGRSMGSRAAVATANHFSSLPGNGLHSFIRGVICLSYPLHKPGDQLHLRETPLKELSYPCLMISGDRDNMCEAGLLKKVIEGRSNISIKWVEGGDHGLHVKGRDDVSVVEQITEYMTSWCKQTESEPRPLVEKSGVNVLQNETGLTEAPDQETDIEKRGKRKRSIASSKPRKRKSQDLYV